MLGVIWRSLPARVRAIQKQSRLLLFVLVSFVAGYLGVGYWLFSLGLTKLHQFPLIGSLLSQRILFLTFGFFLVMLTYIHLHELPKF
jgi:hypothetical protein